MQLYATAMSAVQESPISKIKQYTLELFFNVLVSEMSHSSDGRLFQPAGPEWVLGQSQERHPDCRTTF